MPERNLAIRLSVMDGGKVKAELKVPIATDIHEIDQAEPVAAVAEEARALANPPGGRGKAVPKRLNQAKAVSELIPALLWVAYSGPSCGE